MDILTGADSSASSADIFHFPQDPFDFDQISDTYGPLSHDYKAADEIINDILSAEAHTDSDGAAQKSKSGKRDIHHSESEKQDQ